MERILYIAIALVFAFPVFSQETGYDMQQPIDIENQSNSEKIQIEEEPQNYKTKERIEAIEDEPSKKPIQEEDKNPYSHYESTTGGNITPHFSCDYLHGKLFKAKDIPNTIGSNYFQLSATLSTGTQPGSYFNWYKKPEIGLTFMCGLLGNYDVLGSVFALYPTWKYSFFETSDIGLSIKLGTGLAWFTNPYDKFDNSGNTLIGSHLNNGTEIGLNAWFRFHPQWKIEAGTSFLHFSNCHTKIPNIGINDLTAKVGVVYEPGTLKDKTTRVRHLPAMDSAWKKTIMVSLGRHKLANTTYPTDGPSYNVYKLSGYVSKRLTNINEIQFGASVSYYEGYYEFIHLTDYYKHFQHLMSSVVMLHIGHEFLINRFGFDTDLGIKVFNPFHRSYVLNKDNSLWHKAYLAPKIGFKFYPIWNSFDKQKLALGIYIKSNGLQADYLEYSLSYTF